MPLNEREQQEQLDRFWTAGARDAAVAPDRLDPALAATVRRLHEVHQPPDIDPAFQRRLAADLLEGDPPLSTLPVTRLHTSQNGHAGPRSLPLLAVAQRAPYRPRLVAHLATAALILLTLVSSFVAFGPIRSGFAPDTATIVPAVDVVPITNGVMEATLLDTTVEGVTAGFVVLALEHWTLAPSATPFTLFPLGGPRVVAVERGAVRATVAGTEQRLGAGDHRTVPGDQGLSLVNPGPDDAIVAVVYLVPSYDEEGGDSASPTQHLARWPAFTVPEVLASSTLATPAGRSHLLLQRLSLAPEAEVPAQEASALSWIEIDAGTLGLTLEGPRLPYGWQPGIERTIRVGEYLPKMAPGTRMVIRNAGEDDLVLYHLTMAPEGTGTALTESSVRARDGPG